MVAKYNNLPPIIQQLIEGLNNPNASLWERDNKCYMLEKIKEACEVETANFQKEKQKYLIKKGRKG